MKIRQNILPRRLYDAVCVLLEAIFISVAVIYNLIIVLPAFHEPGSNLYILTILLSIFLIQNVVGNIIACIIADTSVEHEHIDIPPEGHPDRFEWRHCSTCDRLAPPRSWHCKVCKVCILKRDHHCLFTGCCIGHRNLRYFMCFLFYAFIGLSYTTVYNMFYLWKMFPGSSLMHIKLMDRMEIIHRIVIGSSVVILKATISFLYSYVPLVLRGEVSAKNANKIKYNCGVDHNLKSVFGQRMLFAILSPLLSSELPENGYKWKLKSTKKPKKT